MKIRLETVRNWFCTVSVVFCILCVVGLYFTRDSVTDTVYGVNVGNGEDQKFNRIRVGALTEVSVYLKRKFPNDCDVKGKIHLVGKDISYVSKPLFELDYDKETVAMAHKLSPGLFRFYLKIPKGTPTSEATNLVTVVKYSCLSRNPIFPGELRLVVPVELY